MTEQRLVLGDCLDVFTAEKARIEQGEAEPFDIVNSDCPAGISFMGREWDRLHGKRGAPRITDDNFALLDLGPEDAFSDYWAKRLLVARQCSKPGAVSITWSLPRTQDLTMRALRLAGWRIVDSYDHVFGTGWNKSGEALRPGHESWIIAINGSGGLDIEACRVPRGGEPIPVFAVDGRWARTGGDPERRASRVGESKRGSLPTNMAIGHADRCERAGTRKVRGGVLAPFVRSTTPPGYNAGHIKAGRMMTSVGYSTNGTESLDAYRCAVECSFCRAEWLALSGGDAPRCACGGWAEWACPRAAMDAESGTLKSGTFNGERSGLGYGGGDGTPASDGYKANEGGASRFFHDPSRIGYAVDQQHPRFPMTYRAKASSAERHAGCEHLYWKVAKKDPFGFVQVMREEWETLPDDQHGEGNVHATVKSVSLMLHLLRLGGASRSGPHRVADLCAGSGGSAIAAYLLGIPWLGAEVCPQAVTISEARLAWWRGCSPSAIARFMTDEELPASTAPQASPAQLSLLA